MGYVGRVTRLPKGDSPGLIRSNLVEGLDTPFDAAAMARSTGPGGMGIGAVVYFSRRNGKAVSITRSFRHSEARIFEQTKGRGSRAKGLTHR